MQAVLGPEIASFPSMKAEDLNAKHFVLDLKAGAELRARIKQDPQAGLKQAAQQFEGMLLQMMLKSMRDATPQDGLLNSDQTRFFTSILDQQLAQNAGIDFILVLSGEAQRKDLLGLDKQPFLVVEHLGAL